MILIATLTTTSITLHSKVKSLDAELTAAKAVKCEPAPEPVRVLETVYILPSTIGVTNNNPLNVKGTGWQGQIGNDEFGHAVFSHHAFGLRAGAMVIKNYQHRHGLMSLKQMMRRYCTANQEKYAAFIAKRIGVSVNEKFDVLTVLPEMLKAMVHFENGENPYPDHDFALAGVYVNNKENKNG